MESKATNLAAGENPAPASGDAVALAQVLAHLVALERKVDLLRAVKASPEPVRSHPCLVTFVSPCFNEESNLDALHARITEACRARNITSYEILWIENGSKDESLPKMRQLQSTDPLLRVIQLSRNFGYQGAISCGLLYAQGEWVGILDADLQDPPDLLVQMLERAQAAALDVVYGVRKKRREGIFKRMAYRLFYRLWRLTADITVPLDAGDFGIMHQRVVQVINSMPERQRFVRGLRAWSGFKQEPFPYERHGRHAGETKFNLRGMVSLALDGLISYSILPLRATLFCGAILIAIVLALSFVQAVFRLLAYMHVVEITAILPPGLTQVSLILSALLGLNMVCVGVVGEYVGRIYNETKDRPLFVVRSVSP